MLNEIKEMLINNPEKIVELLEMFSFEHINHRNTEIRFARSDTGGANISIRLKNNPYCVVSDWSRGISTDIISYIIREKNSTFREVLQAAKKILGLGNDWRPQKKKTLFNGIYDNILRPNKDISLKTYNENILNQYECCGNLRFLRDGISLESQRFWGVRFSVEDNAIIIPIRNEYSELVGIKARINWEPNEDESKYYYPISVAAKNVLYGYSENYAYLYGNDIIIAESEKAVMQAWSFGVRNIIGLGSNNLSEKQTKLILQLQPKRIIIALDEGLSFDQTQKNADMIKNFCTIFTPEIWYWDATQNLDINHKDSPTDNGFAMFKQIIDEQLVRLY